MYGQNCYTVCVDFPGPIHEAQIKFVQVTEPLAAVRSRSAGCRDSRYVHLYHLEMKRS